MQDTIDFDNLFANSIDRSKGKAGKDKLARSWLAAPAALKWKLRERAQSVVNS